MRIKGRRLLSALATSAMAVTAMASPVLTAPAQASVAGTTHPIPGGSLNSGGVTTLCYDKTGFSCAGAGYNGTATQIGGNGWATWQYWSHGTAGPKGTGTMHNCTTYAAYRLQKNGYAYPGWYANASGWASDASNKSHVTVDQTPIAGSIAQWNNNHVAYVEAVTSTYIVTTSDSYGGGTDRLKILRTSRYMPDNFIHFKNTYVGAIVQWSGDTKAQKTAWHVGADGRRHWIPSTAVYSCLVNGGVTGPYALPSSVLDTVMPDDTGSSASCGADLNGDGIVNSQDLSILQSEWHTPGHRADINLDGTVNVSDLSILSSQYGKKPTAVVIPAP
jgi:surface antigen